MDLPVKPEKGTNKDKRLVFFAVVKDEKDANSEKDYDLYNVSLNINLFKIISIYSDFNPMNMKKLVAK